MNQLEQLKQEAIARVQNIVTMSVTCRDEEHAKSLRNMAEYVFEIAYQAGKLENPCIEHCSEPSCPECNIAAYKAGQQNVQKQIMQLAEKDMKARGSFILESRDLVSIINLINSKE